MALTCTLHWSETDLLVRQENLTGLARLNRELEAQVEGVGSPHRVALDMDSSESPVYGQQEQSAYNGYFGSVCYHPLFLFNSQGDCLATKLRPGNVHSAEGWEKSLLPEIEGQQLNGKEVAFRPNAASAGRVQRLTGYAEIGGDHREGFRYDSPRRQDHRHLTQARRQDSLVSRPRPVAVHWCSDRKSTGRGQTTGTGEHALKSEDIQPWTRLRC